MPTAAGGSFTVQADAGLSTDDLESMEWLLTDAAGGMAMGTVAGIPGRRYHAWLIAALAPPVGRVALLNSVVETVVLIGPEGDEESFDFSSFRFPGAMHPRGASLLVEFTRDRGAAWTYRAVTARHGAVTVRRELVVLRPGAIAVRYGITGASAALRGRLELRPLVSMRDFHELCRQDGSSPLSVETRDGRVIVHRGDRLGECEIPALNLSLRTGSAWRFGGPSQWWNNFEYALDRARGQDFREDLFVPGVITAEISAQAGQESQYELRAWIGEGEGGEIEHVASEQAERARAVAETLGASGEDRPIAEALVRAADQFIVRRRDPAWRAGMDATDKASVIAGYPWFSDWGRDAMISLPGLLLSTGRFAEAREVLEAFAGMIRNGLVPNCFDNGTGAAQYNTVDASLWFIHAAARYVAQSKDDAAAERFLAAACMQIIESYERGTDFGIRVDPSDGLVSAGDVTTQLTWMDAKRDGVVFTPRAGKAVEINALWYGGLLSAADVLEKSRPRTSRDLRQIAEKVRASFQAKFFDAYRQMCFDLVPGGPSSHGPGRDPAYQVRPNQIFAVSLPYSPLNAEQQQAVVRSVRQTLLTPMGLRTLAPSDQEYHSRFEGTLFARDRAYHNGTVWPWLIGPMAEAVMRVGQFSRESRAEAASMIRPLVQELMHPRPGRAVGQLAEVYDGDETANRPRRPSGCPAQAWSVAEVLRVWVMANGRH
ncbi:MAG: 4-alpha-glucanotransferase [Phycisphaerae bacterium]